MKGVAFCPAHVTGFFKAEIENQSLSSHVGSLGAGFSIAEGVTTSVSARKKTPSDTSNFHLEVDGYQTQDIHVSKYVIDEFLKIVGDEFFVDVHHEISVPVGYGLGCSAAVALSLGLALNKALGTKLSKDQVGQIAHKAEVNCKTGLGDVLGAFNGGFEIRTKGGAPGIGFVEKIHSDSSVIMICFSPISTKKFLDEKLDTINGLGGKMVKKLIQSRDCDDFQDMSIEFAKYIQVLTPKMESVINELHANKIKCGVALFGETVFALIPNSMQNKVKNILEKFDDGIIISSAIDNAGARLTN